MQLFFCKSILFTSQIGFDIALTDVEATLKQHWDNGMSMLKQRWNNILQCWETVALTLCNVDLTFFQGWTPPMYQFCATWKIRFRILFRFQRWISVIWTVIYNVETTLTQCWNDGRAISMKKLILRNIMPATLLTKLILWVFFKDYTKRFKTPIFTNFFWCLLLRIRLRLLVSSSSGLLKMPS